MTSKLLIGNISTSVKEEDLKEIFTQIVGNSVTVSIPRNPKTGSIRGYAFVELESDVLAEKALDALNGSPVDGSSTIHAVLHCCRYSGYDPHVSAEAG